MTSVAPQWLTDPSETAASYERVSRKVQSLYGHGLKRQERNVDDMARDLGVNLPPELRFRDGVDDNASGADWALPELDRLMALARAGRFKTLLIPTSDRWTRDTPKGLWMTRQVRDYGVRVVWGDIPDVPEATDGSPYPDHWRQKMEVEAFMDAELERAKIRWRTMNGRRDKAAGGRVVGQGSAPYGYRYLRDDSPKRLVYGLEVYEPEAKVVREIYARARTSPVGDLLVWLDEEKIAPPGASRTFRKERYTLTAGVRWADDAVYRILNSRLYTGQYSYGSKTFSVPEIVTEDVFERVAEALASRKSRRGPARSKTLNDEFLFRGRLVCEPCTARHGSDVVLQSKRATSGGDRYYLCPYRFLKTHDPRYEGVPRCPLPSIRAEVIEERTWSDLIAALRDPERLRNDLADARERRRLDDSGRHDQQRAIEASITQQERRLAIHVKRLVVLDADGTPESDEERPIHESGRDEAKQLLVRLRRELREVQAAPGVGISDDEAHQIGQLAQMVDEVGTRAEPHQRRHLIALLGLRARLGGDGDEIVVQRKPKRTTRVAWSGAIDLTQAETTDSSGSFLKFRMQLLPSGRLVFAA